MAPSTSLASPRPDARADFALPALERFYALHARVYDWTRPLLLLGRRRLLRGLELQPGMRVLDVGCGTGYSLPHLARHGARVRAVEVSPHMRERAGARLAALSRAALAAGTPPPDVRLDRRPYGSHAGYQGWAHRVLFSYSLSMIPPYPQVLERAAADLRPGGRVAVVDFLDAAGPVAFGLRRSHVLLGPERLEALRGLFPRHRLEVGRGLLWRYFIFWGERD